MIVWSSLALLILVLCLGAWAARTALDDSELGLDIGVGLRSEREINHVVYGWRHVPPHGYANMDPSRVGDRVGDTPVICTVRQPAGGGRYVCDEYAIIYPGWKVVVLPDSYPQNVAPCRGAISPGGRVSPCPIPAPAVAPKAPRIVS